jgi:hypothetical protein
VIRSATFSPCRTWRYALERQWGDRPALMVVGLNPSTADETHDDPTVRRCIDFARRWGFGRLVMANLFAFRATDPDVMRAAADPVGAENDGRLLERAADAGMVLAAWGVHGGHLDRDRAALPLLGKAWCLGETKAGFPRHPLYMRADSVPRRYGGRA